MVIEGPAQAVNLIDEVHDQVDARVVDAHILRKIEDKATTGHIRVTKIACAIFPSWTATE